MRGVRGCLALTLWTVAQSASAEVQITPPLRCTYRPVIAWNGSSFGVGYVWGNAALSFRLVDTIGSTIGPNIDLLNGPFNFDLTYAAGQWAAVIEGGWTIGFIAFDDAGNVIVPLTKINTKTPIRGVATPSIAWTGAGYYVAWAYDPSLSDPPKIDVAVVDTAGAIVVPDTFLRDPTYSGLPVMAWDSGSGRVGCSWLDLVGSGPVGSLGVNVAGDGTATGSMVQVSPDDVYPRYARLTGHGKGFGLGAPSRITKGPAGASEVYYTPLDSNMDPLAPPIRLADNGDHFVVGNLVWTGSAFLWPVEYYELPAIHLEIYFYRLNRAGKVLGTKQRVPDGDSRLGEIDYGPRGAMGRNAVGIVWHDYRNYPNINPCGPDVYYDYVPTVEILAGKGANPVSAPQVRSVSSYRGELVLDFLAYGSTGYGVDVGAGNIDAQQLDEILTGPGPGPAYGPQVRAFTGGEESIAKVNFYAYGTLKYGVHVAAGDLDGDGMAEIVTGAGAGSVFGPHVRGFDYDGTAVSAINKISFYAYPTLKYGVEVAGGRVDGDAYAEVLTGPGPSAAFGPQLRGWNYDNAAVAPIAAINVWPFTTRHGLDVGAGDLTGDGRAEILASPGPDPAAPTDVRAYDFPGSLVPLASVTPFPGSFGGAHVGAGDLDLQGGEELVATPGFLPGNLGLLEAYGLVGSSFQEIPKYVKAVFPGYGYGATCAIGNVGI